MADIHRITIRYYSETDIYHHQIDNRPLKDINQRIELVNSDLEQVFSEVHSARGAFASLNERISRVVDENGVFSSSDLVIPANHIVDSDPVSALDPSYLNQKVAMALFERDKLSQIDDRATYFKIKLDDEDNYYSGKVRFVSGKTIRMYRLPTSQEGENVIFIDTVFPHDRLHQHRYHQMIRVREGNLFKIPFDNDKIVPGSVRVWLGGQQIRKSSYEEVSETKNGRITHVKIVEGEDLIDLDLDDLWVEYEICPLWDSVAIDPIYSGIGIPSRYEHTLSTIDGSDLKQMVFDSNYLFWLVDISHLNIVVPYDKCMLFVTEDSWPTTSSPYGGTYRRYGEEWDIIRIGGGLFLRWRYDVSGDMGNSDSGYLEWLTEMGSGTKESPNFRSAPVNLTGGERMDLIYYAKFNK